MRKLIIMLSAVLLPMTAAANDRPNIIIMVADDLGWADVGFHGGDIDTPSLDRIAAEGVELSRFYTTPICSPTRAALMTGRDPIRLGVAYAVIWPWTNAGIHPEEHFMPQSFQAAGYQTAMVGKWHLGHSLQAYHPNERGFDHFYGHLHTEVGYFPPFANQGGKDFQQNGVSIEKDGYESYILADEVSRYIRDREQDKPFFIYMPFIAPHTPLEAPDDLVAKYADLEDKRGPARSRNTDESRKISRLTGQPSARPMFAAVVDGMDQAIGRVLDTLDEKGIADNTIVLFFSDNGGAAYASGGADNAPLRGGKGETWEGGIRVVSLLRWPAALEGGAKMDQIMSAMDVFPTLAEAAGITPGNEQFELDGRSMWPAIADGERQPREDLLFFTSETPIRGRFMFTAFNDHWKLVQEVEQGLLSATVTNHLFRISEDPNEYNNLASEYPEVVEELAGEIHYWRTLYPVAGTRSELVPPPGWRAPKDWATYPRPIEETQDTSAPGMPPPYALKPLDWQHGEAGRLIYNCEPYKFAGGGLCK
ncbi:arylsulfatase [Halioglobus sp. HI00S01]|uniref:sulfatase-like hydrolase/transferase n=1 Tax=Halioglobus sp. HI00S01 TaxID=1822214 RepID=UPI0007C30738|nr:sulfatase-like hydrolase/transferase [Halioglobus sp. HI00S01]KZX60662.1 arylsulfatase [Halioglobus sp. HI00S01]